MRRRPAADNTSSSRIVAAVDRRSSRLWVPLENHQCQRAGSNAIHEFCLVLMVRDELDGLDTPRQAILIVGTIIVPSTVVCNMNSTPQISNVHRLYSPWVAASVQSVRGQSKSREPLLGYGLRARTQCAEGYHSEKESNAPRPAVCNLSCST